MKSLSTSHVQPSIHPEYWVYAPTCEILCDLLIPQSHIRLAIVDDRPQLGVLVQLVLQGIHPLDATHQIMDFLFVRQAVKGFNDVFDGFPEDSGQPVTHSRVGEGVSVVTTERWPWRVVRIDLSGYMRVNLAGGFIFNGRELTEEGVLG